MRVDEFTRWLAGLSELTGAQRKRLLAALSTQGARSQIVGVLEAHGVPACPHCGAAHPVHNGRRTGLQRYLCHACERSFNVLTGTPLARLHRSAAWAAFAQAMVAGLSVRQAAARCGVHRNTAQRWRHRFLALPSAMQAKALAGIAEADETFFRHSHKGSRKLSRNARKRGRPAAKRGRSDAQICVLVARDRGGRTLSTVMPQFDHDTLKDMLKPRLKPDTILCTDGLPVYRAFAQDTDIAHQTLNLAQGIRVKDKVFHIQNVNAYHSRLKTWMRRFNGVATRYLPNYLGWFRMLDALGDSIAPQHVITAALGRPYPYSMVT